MATSCRRRGRGMRRIPYRPADVQYTTTGVPERLGRGASLPRRAAVMADCGRPALRAVDFSRWREERGWIVNSPPPEHCKGVGVVATRQQVAFRVGLLFFLFLLRSERAGKVRGGKRRGSRRPGQYTMLSWRAG